MVRIKFILIFFILLTTIINANLIESNKKIFNSINIKEMLLSEDEEIISSIKFSNIKKEKKGTFEKTKDFEKRIENIKIAYLEKVYSSNIPLFHKYDADKEIWNFSMGKFINDELFQFKYAKFFTENKNILKILKQKNTFTLSMNIEEAKKTNGSLNIRLIYKYNSLERYNFNRRNFGYKINPIGIVIYHENKILKSFLISEIGKN